MIREEIRLEEMRETRREREMRLEERDEIRNER